LYALIEMFCPQKINCLYEYNITEVKYHNIVYLKVLAIKVLLKRCVENDYII